MAKYGNIMTVYNCTNGIIKDIKDICNQKGLLLAIKENNFYIETISKKNTRELIDAITLLNIEFLFFHNHNSDGSVVESNGLDNGFLKDVNQILFL